MSVSFIPEQSDICTFRTIIQNKPKNTKISANRDIWANPEHFSNVPFFIIGWFSNNYQNEKKPSVE